MLISAGQVRPEHLLLDARFRLNDPAAGRALYLLEHIPGAQFVDLDRDLSGEKTGKNGRHPLPSRAHLKELFSSLGIERDTEVVVYDDADHAGAARAWMLLRWMGHEKVAVLNGGLRAWKEAGGAVEKGPVTRARSLFFERAPLVNLYFKDELKGRRLVDARAPERYRGEVEPLDRKAGHIPGAENLFYQTLLGPDGKFRARNELERLLPKGDSVFYCGSGVTACTLLFGASLLGEPAALYPGSWSEWSANGLPVETGSFRPGVVAVVERAGKVLLFQRSDHPESWQFPQGGLEGAEIPVEALHREMREEVGMQVRVLGQGRAVTTYEWPKPDGRNEFRGQRHTWFRCEALGEPDLASGDGSFWSYEWVSVGEAVKRFVSWKQDAVRAGLRGLDLW